MMFARERWGTEPHQEVAHWGPPGFLPRGWSVPKLRQTGLALPGHLM